MFKGGMPNMQQMMKQVQKLGKKGFMRSMMPKFGGQIAEMKDQQDKS